MKIAVDLHIHSGLSPCSENDMTPNNIINMAILKGLDAIAITDHNSTKNLKAFMEIAKDTNILVVPGIEVTTKEEVHLLVLFTDLATAETFQSIIDLNLPNIPNNKTVFGNQFLYNNEDEIIGEYDKLLISGLNISIEEVVKEANQLNAIVIPAHINRRGFSILYNLGFISPGLNFTTVEVTTDCILKEIETKHPYLKDYRKIINSDAHNLATILERQSFLEVEERTIEGVIRSLKRK